MQVFTDAASGLSAEDAATLTDLVAAATALRDVAPVMHEAVLEATRRIDALAAADEDRRQELAALGAKLNALLDRPDPAAVEIADHLARQDDRLAELHSLVDRLHTVAVTARPSTSPVEVDALRGDVSLGLEVLTGIAQRLDQLDERIDAPLARPAEPPAPDLGPLIVAVRELRSELTERLEGARPPDVELPVDEVVAAVAERTEAGLAAVLRLIDARLDHLREGRPGDGGDGGDGPLLEAVESLAASLTEIAGKQDELATALVALREPSAGDRSLRERLDGHLADLARQLEHIAGQLDATLTEVERRQPLVTSDSLKRAAASVREAVSSRRR